MLKGNFMYISKTIITCKNCGEKYYLIEENYPMRDKDKLPCEKCGFILKNWDNAVIYSLEPVSQKEDKIKNKIKSIQSFFIFYLQKHPSAGVRITTGCTAAGLTRCRLRTFVMCLFFFFFMRN